MPRVEEMSHSFHVKDPFVKARNEWSVGDQFLALTTKVPIWHRVGIKFSGLTLR